MGITGHATSEGTRRYKQRMDGKTHSDHFREKYGLSLSSIGMGSYLGNPDDSTDQRYTEAVKRAIELGCNVIDTSINYRFQRSERALGNGIRELIQQGKIQRDEIIVATKGGFIPGDTEPPRNFISYFDETFVKTGVAAREDLVMGCHCMTPSYIQNQLDASLKNLGLDCLDIYYLHNPETQLEEVPEKDFYEKLLEAFETLEKNVSDNKIQFYGTATWNGYRVNSDSPEHLELEKIIKLAETVGGKQHHFRVVQLPLNLAMPEALAEPSQTIKNKVIPMLSAVEETGMIAMASASMLQGQLTRNLPAHLIPIFGSLSKDSQRAIQFARSAPGLTTALVGMSHAAHVEENMAVAMVSPIRRDEFIALFSEE